MAQVIEFMGNHPMLMFAFFLTLGMLLFTEYSRLFSGVKQVSPFAATQILNNGDALILDVREESEYKRGHVMNAMNVPVSHIDKRLHEIEKYKDQDVLLYCESGMRSGRAGNRLKKEGFAKLHNLAGGIAAWEKANLPVVTR